VQALCPENVGQTDSLSYSVSSAVAPRSGNLAVQAVESSVPLCLIGGLAGSKIDAHSAEFGGAACLRGVAEYVLAPGDFKVNEAGHDHGHLKLCFQQSTGYSTRPQVYLLFGTFRHRFLDQNVADLQTAVRLEHPRHLFQAGRLIGHQVENAV
jgi:hypothetical protein